MNPSNPPVPRRALLALIVMLLPLAARAQMAAGKDKFVGNIINSSVPASFNTYWNQVTPENGTKWGSVEATRNVMNWTDADRAYNHAKTNGFKFKLHTLVWGSQYPSWITGLSSTEARAEVEEWINQAAARYPDVWAVDVVNEPIQTPMPASLKAGLGGDGTTGWDWVITSFQLARAKFPNAKLFINEYGTETNATARNQLIGIITLLKERNLIDGIGIQAHAFNLDNMTAAQMTTCLDAYAATGLDLYITELDIRGPLATEASQSSKYQELFPVMWTHPAVKGITLWGYIVGQTWLANTGILNSDGTERAALTWLKGYVSGVSVPAVPAAPSGLAATAASSSQISLTWTDNATNETAYKVEQAASASGPWTEITGSLAAGSTSYTVTGLSASTTYFFRVRASSTTGGDSGYSAAASATTSAAVVTPPPSQPSGGGGGGGGGGAPSLWFIALLALTALCRLRSWRG
ncbi:MAG TPA: endo-1,4-beta-xylanase [Lacunisphaera sp.]|nr:endo-1,4-beta-xylanase [Lacunisphaera sp.]